MIWNWYCRLYQGIFRVVSPLLPWREPKLVEGSVLALPAEIRAAGIERLLIITDKGIRKLGLLDPLVTRLEESGIQTRIYDETVPNPTVENVEKALELYHRYACQGILAFGGGSPMDCAKGVGARVARPTKTLASMKGVLKVRKPLPPLFAVPTTAGTGSEVTLAAVLSNPGTHEKYAISDTPLIPHYAVLDPQLTLGLPPAITAATGMDALTHAVEAYIGRSNTKKTRADSLEASRLILNNLPRVYANGQDLEARDHMMKAAYLAGRAFTRAYVGNIHAIAHTLGGFYQVPHGLANSVILPHVLEFYGEKATKPLAEIARFTGVAGEKDSDSYAASMFIQKIRTMNRAMAIPETIPEIREEDIPDMVNRAFHEANPLYPVPVIFSKRDFTFLYRKIMGENPGKPSTTQR